MTFLRCPPLVQRIALPAFTVTWAGVNLKLTMPTSAAPAGTAGGGGEDVAGPADAIWPAGIGMGMEEEALVAPAAVPWPAVLKAAGAQAASPTTAIAAGTAGRRGAMRRAGASLP